MKTRALLSSLLLLTAGLASAQGWSEAYGKALTAISQSDWSTAKAAFTEAIALRPDDQSSPTNLPGPVTDPRKWRDGAPYSPNFGAAYCAYRQALQLEGVDRDNALGEVAKQLEALLMRKQASAETVYLLNQIYSRTRDIQKLDSLKTIVDADSDAFKWKVDSAIMTPEERAAVASLLPKPANQGGPTQQGGPKTTVIKAENLNSAGNPTTTAIGSPPAQGEISTIAGRVPAIASKYALVIGNSESMMADAKLEYASSDAVLVRDTLVQHAGYLEENIDVVVNATAAQILASAKAIAERMPQDGVLFLYFSGAGFNIGGKDYIAGIDAETPSDSMHMVPVSEIYKMFIAKGTSVFAFTQAERPISSGLYFGKETPLYGRVSQAHATIPGDKVYSLVTSGKTVGSYTQALVDILTDFRSNQVPITEFVWQVFYRMRRGGGPQTPTLPVLTVMSADARF